MLVETPEAERESPLAAVPQPRGIAQRNDWRPITEYAALVTQLALLAVVIWRYNLENPAFLDLTLLAFAGFAIHYLLPRAYRLPFFLLLSLAGIVLVLDWQAAAWLIGVGTLLIAVCHLPVAHGARVAILAGAAILLMAMRVGWIPMPMPAAVWPLLGSMFMFRIMVYIYDLKHRPAAVSPINSLSYFFLLPNVCFPLFPVVDYQTFCRNYYDDERNRIHQVGVRWIFRGVLHLILYRILYKNCSISPYDVSNAGDIVHYCVWLFLLYLRVSGQFHIIVGMLHLFGFNLPETHKLYYLSSSFTDFWRRINIYWKDFMMKLFFYPIFFRMKKLKPAVALVLSTLFVFFLTWLLHAVQWFWLRGKFLFTTPDIVFWSILASFVVINTLWEFKRGRKRTTASAHVSWPHSLVVGLKTLATFTVICALWSLWSSKSLEDWGALWRYAIVPPTVGGWVLIIAVVAAIFGGALLNARNPSGFRWSRLSFMQESAFRCAVMLVILAVSLSAVTRRIGVAGKWIASARAGGLNALELADMERGYYEDLMDVDRFNGELWSLYTKRPIEWTLSAVEAGIAKPTDDILRYQMLPGVEVKYRGSTVRTNRWGMHDKEYTKLPAADCYRIAIIGSSQAMGIGVVREATFEAVLEKNLNDHLKPGGPASYEVLNFAVTGYEPIRQLRVLTDRVLEFQPKMLIYVGHNHDEKRCVSELLKCLRDGVDLPDEYLRDLVKRAGLEPTMPEPIARRRIEPFAKELLTWLFERLVSDCKSHGIRPVYIILPLTPGLENPSDTGPDFQIAKAAGFETFDTFNVYDGHDYQSLWISDFDTHPNELGHRLVGNRLYEMLTISDAAPTP